MRAKASNGGVRFLGTAAGVFLLAAVLQAADDHARPAKLGDYNSAHATVEMFAAIEKGDIAVKLIPKDASLCHVLIENKTDKPLNVKLPEAFAGVPSLAQIGGGGRAARSGGGSSRNTGNTNQSMGGGMGGMGMGGGMGMFNVPPEKVGKFDVPTVCLEHGKRDPRAAVPYEIKPLESFTNKPGVRELCELLGSGQVNQRAAQAAAWHLNNDMSWEELAAKKIESLAGPSRPYFSAEEIQGAMQLTASAVRTAEERQQQKTEPTSTSQYQPSAN